MHRHIHEKRPPLTAFWPAAAGVCVLLLVRLSGFALNPVYIFCVRAAVAFLTVAAFKRGSFWASAAYCAALPLAGWALNLTEGNMAIAYALSALFGTLAMHMRHRVQPIPLSILTGLIAALTTAVYLFIMLLVKRSMTPGAAALYAVTRQSLSSVAYIAGAMIGLFAFFPVNNPNSSRRT